MNWQLAWHSPFNSFLTANFSRRKLRLLTKSSFLDRLSTTVSSMHNRRYFFRVFAGERGQARSEWEALDKRDGEDAEKTTACPHTIVFLHSAPDIPFNGSPHSLRACIRSGFGLNCLRSPEKRTPVMQASQLAWYGNSWKRDLQLKTAQLDVH